MVWRPPQAARRNEILAFRWTDLDPEKRTLRIERAWEPTQKVRTAAETTQDSPRAPDDRLDGETIYGPRLRNGKHTSGFPPASLQGLTSTCRWSGCRPPA